jgi:hypothetical protein
MIHVLTCFGGPNLVPFGGDTTPRYMLDPARVHPGVVLRVDAQRLAPAHLLVTSDHIAIVGGS